MNAVRFVSKWPFDEHSELHTSFGIALSGILRNRTLSIRHLPFGTVPFGALALAIRKIIADHWRSLEITAEHPLSTQKLASNLFKSSNLPKFKIQNRIGRLHLAESTGRVESGYRTATERKNRLNAGRVLSTARPKSDLQKAANLPARKAHSKRNYLNELNGHFKLIHSCALLFFGRTLSTLSRHFADCFAHCFSNYLALNCC